ncbi:hypothetical protein [Photobacterium ganghwense]|uniref:hypothetical protein n=1 Tax=Photobacterium ganghwense TaxID=320778 RepID=UPI0039EDFAE8
MSRIHLITTCTNNKKSTDYQSVQLRDSISPDEDIETSAALWSEKLESALRSNRTLAARDLYKGGHWSIAKSIADEHQVELWILSAGFGLLNQNSPVVNYQATFTPNSDDCIPKSGGTLPERSSRWWSALANHIGRTREYQDITSLMRNNPYDFFVVSGSSHYIHAIYSDLLTGLVSLKNPSKQLMVITSASENLGELTPYTLLSKQKMKQRLGGTMVTLNVALARHVLLEVMGSDHSSIDFSVIKQSLEKSFADLLPNPIPERTRRTEEEVKTYVADLLTHAPKISASTALRYFRDSGNSFEEKRFRKAFQEVLSGRKS